MVNNSNNINKVVNNSNNITLYSNKRNSHLTPQIIEHKKTTTYIDGNPGPGFRQEQKCPTVAELNQPVVALYLILI